MVGGVYKIKEVDYIGSCKCFKERVRTHNICLNNPSKKEYNTDKYNFIRENNITIELIILEECDDNLTTQELKIREQHYIDLLNPSLNKCRAYRTNEQRLEDSLKRSTDRYKNKKDTINAENKIPIKCECGEWISKRNMTRHINSTKHYDLLNPMPPLTPLMEAQIKKQKDEDKKLKRKIRDKNNKAKLKEYDANSHRKNVCKKALNDIISQIELMHS